jgi:hypothetical protein
MHARTIACLAFLVAATFLGSVHAQTSCITDHDCQDGSWCNGVERCVGNPGKPMCQPAPRPMCSAKKRCDETAMKCLSPRTEAKTHDCPKGQAYSVVDDKCVAAPPI